MPNQPSRNAILQQLECILASPEFSVAPRMTALLRHLVTCTLDDKAGQLTGYAIGLDVFGRGPAFDPAQDSIVRVQMTRLRRMLDEYYAAADAMQDIVITIPKGQYRARFAFGASPTADAAASAQADDDASGPLSASVSPAARASGWARITADGSMLALVAVGLFGILAFALAVLLGPRAGEPALRTEPTVLVARYTGEDKGLETRLIVRGIQRDLIAELARYNNFDVIGYDTAAQIPRGQKARQAQDADYTLSGEVDVVDGKVNVYSRLTENRSGVVVWADDETLDIANTSDLFAVHQQIAFNVASTLGQSYGVIQNAGRRLAASSAGVSFGAYACVLSAYDYMRAKSARVHRDVRACLEKTTRSAPDYASAWALLSWVHGDEARYGFNPSGGEPATLRALQAAKRAVSADTRSAMAHQYLAIAQYYLGRDAEALNSAGIALALSPNDSEVLANVGWIYAFVGDPQQGEALMQRAVALNPLHPNWYWWGKTVHAIRQNRAEDALRMSQLYTDDRPMSDYVRIAAERMNGQDSKADAMLRELARQDARLGQADNDFLKRNRLPGEVVRLIFGQ